MGTVYNHLVCVRNVSIYHKVHQQLHILVIEVNHIWDLHFCQWQCSFWNFQTSSGLRTEWLVMWWISRDVLWCLVLSMWQDKNIVLFCLLSNYHVHKIDEVQRFWTQHCFLQKCLSVLYLYLSLITTRYNWMNNVHQFIVEEWLQNICIVLAVACWFMWSHFGEIQWPVLSFWSHFYEQDLKYICFVCLANWRRGTRGVSYSDIKKMIGNLESKL